MCPGLHHIIYATGIARFPDSLKRDESHAAALNCLTSAFKDGSQRTISIPAPPNMAFLSPAIPDPPEFRNRIRGPCPKIQHPRTGKSGTQSSQFSRRGVQSCCAWI